MEVILIFFYSEIIIVNKISTETKHTISLCDDLVIEIYIHSMHFWRWPIASTILLITMPISLSTTRYNQSSQSIAEQTS